MAGILRAGSDRLWTSNQVCRSGGVPRINWAHPLTYGLISYWLSRDAGFIDLVTGDTTKKGTGTSNLLPVSRASPFGTGPAFNASLQACESINFAPAVWNFPYSFAGGWWQIGATSGSGMGWFGVSDIGNNNVFIISDSAANTIRADWGNAGGQMTLAVAANTFYVYVGAATGTATQANYVNGIVRTAGTNTSNQNIASMGYVWNINSYNGGAASVFTNALVFFFAAWKNRALTQAESVQLYTDPYCFLMPQEGEMPALFVSAAAPQQEELNWSIYRIRRRGWGH